MTLAGLAASALLLRKHLESRNIEVERLTKEAAEREATNASVREERDEAIDELQRVNGAIVKCRAQMDENVSRES